MLNDSELISGSVDQFSQGYSDSIEYFHEYCIGEICPEWATIRVVVPSATKYFCRECYSEFIEDTEDTDTEDTDTEDTDTEDTDAEDTDDEDTDDAVTAATTAEANVVEDKAEVEADSNKEVSEASAAATARVKSVVAAAAEGSLTQKLLTNTVLDPPLSEQQLSAISVAVLGFVGVVNNNYPPETEDYIRELVEWSVSNSLTSLGEPADIDIGDLESDSHHVVSSGTTELGDQVTPADIDIGDLESDSNHVVSSGTTELGDPLYLKSKFAGMSSGFLL